MAIVTIVTEAYSARAHVPGRCSARRASSISMASMKANAIELTLDYTFTNDSGLRSMRPSSPSTRSRARCCSSATKTATQQRTARGSRHSTTMCMGSRRNSDQPLRYRRRRAHADLRRRLFGDCSKKAFATAPCRRSARRSRRVRSRPPNTRKPALFIQDEIELHGWARRRSSRRCATTPTKSIRRPIRSIRCRSPAKSDSRVTPRFGVVAWPTETFGVFFNYAEGFRRRRRAK